ncbi:MAG: SGNH/GDSL hydrolase family protein [Elusimicrobiota bacterium]
MVMTSVLLLNLSFLGLSSFAGAAENTAEQEDAQPAAIDTGDENDGEGKKPKIEFTWLPFPDNSKFKVLGLYWFEENNPKFWRMPVSKFESLPKGVKRQATKPSGGRIFIKTNSTKLALRVVPHNKGNLKGMCVYINGKYLRHVIAEEPGVTTDLVLFTELDNKEKEVTVYLPYHQEIIVRAVGADKDAKFSAPEPKFANKLPIVFYGSSVCQSSGAGKVGMSYEAQICRALNLDFVNLGFGGAGKAEPEVVKLVSSIPACCYVFDLGKSYGMQDMVKFKVMLETVRKEHPAVPIIVGTPITSTREVWSDDYSKKSIHTRTVMKQAVEAVIKDGMKDVYILNGEDLLGFNEHDGLSRDGVHPSDHGFYLIATRMLPVIKKALGM